MNDHTRQNSIEKSLEREDLRVAILTSDWEVGQELSKVLRLHQVYAFYYAKLDELWQLLSSESIDLAIVDVKNLDDGDRFLLKHPSIIQKKTKLGIYFNPAYHSLLGSLAQTEILGLINSDFSLSHQLAPLINTIFSLKTLEMQNDSLSLEKNQLYNRVVKREVELESFKRNVQRLKKATEVIAKLKHGQVSSPKDFTEVLWKFFHQWRVVKNFTFFMLNSSGQRIVCPEILSDKYVPLSPFWLDKPCLTGIPQHVQLSVHEMLMNHDDFGLTTITLKICGHFDFPEILVCLTTLEEVRPQEFSSQAAPQWMYLEQILSNHFRQGLLEYQQSQKIQSKFQMEIWDALEMLEENSQLNIDGGQRCINIDFSEWNKWLVKPANHKIKYRALWSDFVTMLQETLSDNCRISNYGTWSILVFIPSDLFEANFQKCKSSVNQFEYWRYLNDAQLTVPSQIKPKIQILANDPKYYLKRCVLDLMPLPEESKMDHYAGPQLSSH